MRIALALSQLLWRRENCPGAVRTALALSQLLWRRENCLGAVRPLVIPRLLRRLVLTLEPLLRPINPRSPTMDTDPD